MFCKKCGKQIKDGILFCPHCGQKVTMPPVDRREGLTEMPARVQGVEEPAADGASRVRREIREPSPKTGVSKSLMLAVIVGVLIILAAVLAFILFSQHSKEEESGTSQGYEETVGDLNGNHGDNSEMPIGDDEAEAGQELSSDEAEAGQEPVQEEQDNQYILPESDSVYLTISDLEGLTKEECRLARNELYARHGRRFDDEGLQGYFDSCDWYEGTIAPEDFDDSVLNEYEIANRDLIVMYEKEQGYR